jgi:hypothetical protein
VVLQPNFGGALACGARERMSGLGKALGLLGGWISCEKLGVRVDLLVTPMVHSGERNGERKRGSSCGDDAWRRRRRGGLEVRLQSRRGARPATKTQSWWARVVQHHHVQDRGGGEVDRWGRAVQCRSAQVKRYLNHFKTV